MAKPKKKLVVVMKLLLVVLLILFSTDSSFSEPSDLVKTLLDGMKETYEKQGIDGVVQYLSNDFKLKGSRKIDRDFAVKQLKHRANSSSSLAISSITTSLIKYVSSARLEKDMTLVIQTKNGYTIYARPNPLLRGGYSFYQAAKNNSNRKH